MATNKQMVDALDALNTGIKDLKDDLEFGLDRSEAELEAIQRELDAVGLLLAKIKRQTEH